MIKLVTNLQGICRMELLRVFETESWFKEWMLPKPKLEVLLRCFDIDRKDPSQPKDPVSVFEASCAVEEVENVAAQFQTFGGKRGQTQYVIRMDPENCRRAGIQLERCEHEGMTGVRFVDGRHFNLNGTQEDFVRLVRETLAEIWEGQD